MHYIPGFLSYTQNEPADLEDDLNSENTFANKLDEKNDDANNNGQSSFSPRLSFANTSQLLSESK